jgi:hypothetical protein
MSLWRAPHLAAPRAGPAGGCAELLCVLLYDRGALAPEVVLQPHALARLLLVPRASARWRTASAAS